MVHPVVYGAHRRLPVALKNCPDTLPPRLGTVPAMLLLLLALGAVRLQYQTVFGREPGIALISLLMALKLWESRNTRDIHVIALLGYFMSCTLFFYHKGPIGTTYTLLCALLLATGQCALHYPGDKRPPARQHARVAAVLLLQALPLALICFLLFPRIPGPLWRLPGDAGRAVTGLGNSMAPGNISTLVESDTPVFRTNFHGQAPLPEQMYWRGPVFWLSERAHMEAVTRRQSRPYIQTGTWRGKRISLYDHTGASYTALAAGTGSAQEGAKGHLHQCGHATDAAPPDARAHPLYAGIPHFNTACCHRAAGNGTRDCNYPKACTHVRAHWR